MVIHKSNMAGPYHIESGLPCQDSFAVYHDEKYSVLAVTDGLGSVKHSDIGASVAAQTVVEYCSKRITIGMTFDDIKKVMNNALVNAYKAVLTRANEDGNDPDEYDSTLCLAVYDGEHLYYAQSGDSGMVALLENGEYYRVTTQQRDEEGRVFPLCWGPEKWEFGFVDSPVSAFMLMTDGVFEQICPKLMRKCEIEINIPLARRFLDHFDCIEEDVPDLEKAVHQYLEHYPRHLLDDDKTVVVLINPDRKPEEKEDAYYAIPDWKAIRDEAERKLSVVCSDSSDIVGSTDNESLPIGEAATTSSLSLTVDSQSDSEEGNRSVSSYGVNRQSESDKSSTNHIPDRTVTVESTGDKKKRITNRASNNGLNVVFVICLLLFGLLAWLAKDKIEKHMAISALGVLVVCFLANASVLLPSSSILIVVEYSILINPFLVALCGAFGAALGEMMGFYVGRYGGRTIPGKLMKWVKAKMENHKYLIVLLFSVLPLPVFDIVGMLSGAMKMNALKFFGICFAGKLIKMLCYVWLAHELLPLLG